MRLPRKTTLGVVPMRSRYCVCWIYNSKHSACCDSDNIICYNSNNTLDYGILLLTIAPVLMFRITFSDACLHYIIWAWIFAKRHANVKKDDDQDLARFYFIFALSWLCYKLFFNTCFPLLCSLVERPVPRSKTKVGEKKKITFAVNNRYWKMLCWRMLIFSLWCLRLFFF